MRFIIFFFSLLFIAFGSSGQINLCDTICVLRYEPIPVPVYPGHFKTGYELKINDVKYRVTVDKKKKVEFVSTSDSAFSTSTITIGTPYSLIPKKMIKSERPDHGWGYEVVLKDGWIAVFNDPVVFKSLKAYRAARIGWFYKNKPCYENPNVAY